MRKIHYILIGLLPLQIIALRFLKTQSKWLETYYSQGIYPLIFKSHRFFFDLIPFSIGDILYALALFYLIKGILIIFKKQRPKISVLILNIIAISSLLLLIFNLNWGLNYYRTPLHKKLNYNLRYDQVQLEQTFDALIRASNELHTRLNNNDTVAIHIPYSKKKIANKLEEEFDFDLEKFKPKPFIKNSLWSMLLSYMGYSGYLNPFTLESQANSEIPKLNYIITSMHEMAHQLGIASEREANFIAFYTSIKHSDPFIQYAGYTFALRYCFSELYKADQEMAKRQIQRLKPGVLKNFQELTQFWNRYQNPFEPFLKKGYDTYLKANGQKQGIQSYNAMVGLVVAYSQKEPFDLNKK